MASPSRNRRTEKANLDEETLWRMRGDNDNERGIGDALLVGNDRCLATNASRSRRGGGDAFVVGAVYHLAEDLTDITLMDASSGEVVRRMDGLSRPGLNVCAGGDMICVVSHSDGLLRLVDVATGDTTDLSMGCTTAEGNVNVSSGYTLGKVPATGEHKLLHVYASSHGDCSQSSEVLTITGDGDVTGRQWRATQSPPMRIERGISRSRATVDGVVYFLSPATTSTPGHRIECDTIAAFDLATEQWRPTLLEGPLPADQRHRGQRPHLSLAALDGRLVTVHHDYPAKTINLWSLTSNTTATTTWTKLLSLPIKNVLRGWEVSHPAMKPSAKQQRRRGGRRKMPAVRRWPTEAAVAARYRENVAQPLAMLGDGRMALCARGCEGAVRLHDPSTGACEEVAQVEKGGCVVGFYTGKLL
uniref:F-box associated beta-propeller type 1 domain-containing protein n=1 Tax=Oryza punctata TaxID=4537 RepID=A0A0E0LI65_ORYPU